MRTLVTQHLAAGPHSERWNGRDDHGLTYPRFGALAGRADGEPGSRGDLRLAADRHAEDLEALQAVDRAKLLRELEAELKSLIARHRVQMDELIDMALERLVAFHKTLTPEQKAKLVKKLEDFDRWHHPG